MFKVNIFDAKIMFYIYCDGVLISNTEQQKISWFEVTVHENSIDVLGVEGIKDIDINRTNILFTKDNGSRCVKICVCLPDAETIGALIKYLMKDIPAISASAAEC